MRRINVFLGAGASKCFGIPEMKELVNCVKKDHLALESTVDLIQDRLKPWLGENINIEQVLTLLVELQNPIASARRSPLLAWFTHMSKEDFISTFGLSADGNYAPMPKKAVEMIKDTIKRECNPINHEEKNKGRSTYKEFFETIHNKVFGETQSIADDRKINVITTNYDTCFKFFSEYEKQEGNNKFEYSSWFNKEGEILALTKNSPSGHEPFTLTKLHGSIDYKYDKGGRVIISSRDIGEPAEVPTITEDAIIYPMYNKYHRYSMRKPFSKMFNWFHDEMRRCDACIVVGYSFSDPDSKIKNVFAEYLSKSRPNKKCYIIDPSDTPIDIIRATDVDESRIVHIKNEFGRDSIEELKSKLL